MITVTIDFVGGTVASTVRLSASVVILAMPSNTKFILLYVMLLFLFPYLKLGYPRKISPAVYACLSKEKEEFDISPVGDEWE